MDRETSRGGAAPATDRPAHAGDRPGDKSYPAAAARASRTRPRPARLWPAVFTFRGESIRVDAPITALGFRLAADARGQEGGDA